MNQEREKEVVMLGIRRSMDEMRKLIKMTEDNKKYATFHNMVKKMDLKLTVVLNVVDKKGFELEDKEFWAVVKILNETVKLLFGMNKKFDSARLNKTILLIQSASLSFSLAATKV